MFSIAHHNPRMFSSPDRQAALEAFIRGGRVCPGVDRKPHKLATDDRTEFDHILPYAKGGATSLLNIQVLWTDCNRRKRDRA
jgi:HNH endonuclease